MVKFHPSLLAVTPEASLEAVKFDRDCVGSQAVLGRFAHGELGTHYRPRFRDRVHVTVC